MSMEVWIAVGIVFVACWCIIIYGLINAPLMPDDYNEEGINPDYKALNGSKKKKKQTDDWYPDHEI